jgi:hypothetical protein
MRDLLVHQQIPKTATTSVVGLLKDWFTPEAIEVIKITSDRKENGDVLFVSEADDATGETWLRLRNLPEDTLALSIMAPWGFQAALHRRLWAFTFVREPLTRLASYWNFSCSAAKNGKPSFAPFRDVDFDLDTALTRMISLSFFNEQTRMISGSNRIWLCKDDLQRAQEVICEKLSFIGLVESFDVSMKVLGKLLRKPCASAYRLNSAAGNYTFPLNARQLDLLEDLNEWDLKLYAWIVGQMNDLITTRRDSSVAH